MGKNKKVNWSGVAVSAKNIKRTVKTLQQAGEFLREFPEEGYMVDNISKKIVVIKDAKSSSLRRYTKILDNFYFLVTSEKDKTKILNKKIEIEQELTMRSDALPKKEDK